jgi:hypothetical protein
MKFIDRMIFRFLYDHLPRTTSLIVKRCDKNAAEASKARVISFRPDEDFSVLRRAAYSGQANRDAATIMDLKHG